MAHALAESIKRLVEKSRPVSLARMSIAGLLRKNIERKDPDVTDTIRQWYEDQGDGDDVIQGLLQMSEIALVGKLMEMVKEYMDEACHQDQDMFLAMTTQQLFLDFVYYWKESDEFTNGLAEEEEEHQQRMELEVADEAMGDATP